MSVAIAVDLGGSSGRVMKVTLQDRTLSLEQVHRFDNVILEKGEGLYWDVDYLFSQIQEGLALIDYQKGDSISVDTWGVDYTLVDKNGKLLDIPHHYRDSRTEGYLASTLTKVEAKELYQQTGLQFMEINTLFQLMSEKALDEESTLLFIPDYFLYLLSGVKNTEMSIASTSQMLNPLTKDWNRDFLKTLKVKLPNLLDVSKSGKVLGPWVKHDSVSVISGCGHDTQAALVAVPAKEKDFLFLSSGTWSLLGTELDEPILTEEAFKANLTNEVGYGNKTAFLKNLIGLWVIQQLKAEWKISFNEMEELAEKSDAFVAFLDLDDPLFVAPGPMEIRIQEYARRTGQRVPQTRGEACRCVNESLALKYRLAKEQIEHCTNKKYETLYIVGGGSKSPMLSQYTANALKLNVVVGPVEATVCGNALIQFLTRGEINSITEARALIRQLPEIKSVEGKDFELWDKAFEDYKKIIK